MFFFSYWLTEYYLKTILFKGKQFFQSDDIELLCLLFEFGFNVSLTLVQSYRDGIRMIQVTVVPHWSVPVTYTCHQHPIQSHNQLTPGPLAIFNAKRNKKYTLRLLICRSRGSNQYTSVQQIDALPLREKGRLLLLQCMYNFAEYRCCQKYCSKLP